MKTVAVMQPYLFPYIGYFHLIKAVDIFVIYDDVNFIRQGWINRNNILLNDKKHLWTLPVIDASSFRFINQHFISNPSANKAKLLALLTQAYKKAPHFQEVMPLLEDIISFDEDNIALYIRNSLQKLSEYMGIKTEFLISSDIEKDYEASAQDRVIQIVKNLEGSHYCNAIGGQELYSRDAFEKEGIKLSFIQSDSVLYKQYGEAFIPFLSIIDVLMFNDKATINQHLNAYELI